MPVVLRSCPEREPALPPPPKPRTIEALGAWANQLVDAWNRTAAALDACDKRRAELWDLLAQQH